VADTSARDLSIAKLELQKLAQKRPALTTACATLSEMLPAIFTDAATETPLVISPEEAGAKLGAGVPLFRGRPFGIDEPALQRRWAAICASLRQEQAEALTAAVLGEKIRPAALLDAVLSDGPEVLASSMESQVLDPALAATVLRMAVLPALAQITRGFAELRQRIAWDFGYCPNCGSWPLLGEARGLEQDRFLRCGLCAAAWPCGRLFCPFCSNRDYRTLGYVHVEGEEDRYRAGTCDACHGYVKWVSTLFALTGPQLLVADLTTIHLDLAVAERGSYVP
jgi:formate dehydrogenase accessory protein FdhE